MLLRPAHCVDASVPVMVPERRVSRYDELFGRLAQEASSSSESSSATPNSAPTPPPPYANEEIETSHEEVVILKEEPEEEPIGVPIELSDSKPAMAAQANYS